MTKQEFYNGVKLAMIDGTSWTPLATRDGYQQTLYAYVWLPPKGVEPTDANFKRAAMHPNEFEFIKPEHRPHFVSQAVVMAGNMQELMLAGDPNKSVLRKYERLVLEAKAELWDTVCALYGDDIERVRFAWMTEAEQAAEEATH